MTIRPATPTDLPQIRRLLTENRHSFLTCGLEDVPDLLRTGATALGVGPGAAAWGFVAFERPSSRYLPGSVQDGALRVAAIGRRLPPGASTGQLVAQAIAGLELAGQTFQLTALTSEGWLVRLLAETGFAVVDHLCVYQRTRRTLPAAADPALLRPLGQGELAVLTGLDRLTFSPLWRMSEAELLEILFTCRVQAAEVDGQVAGYAALSLHPAQDRYDEAQAQLTRLAVRPAFQGEGIGRQLAIDSLAYAHAQGCYRVLLNTPESNAPAQRLYESLHFRRHGGRIPVLVYPAQL